MDCDKILLTLVSSLILLWVGHLLIIAREKRRSFKAAKDLFGEALKPEIKIFSPEVTSIEIPINWFKYMSDMDNRYSEAIIKIESFLRSAKRKALRKEWETYRDYIKTLPSWFDRDGFYKEEEKIAQLRQGAFQSLCNIIKIAGE